MTQDICFFFFFFEDFIYLLEREREITNRQSGRQREKKKTLCWAGSLMRGSISGPWDYDLSQRQPLN